MQAETEYKLDGADVLVGLFVVAAAVPLNAWVLSVLWAWFVVPFGVAPVGFWAAMGLLVVLGFLRGSRGTQTYKSETAYYQSVAATITNPLISLLIGVIVRGIAP